MSDPLVYKTEQSKPSFNIGVLLQRKKVEGDVGLEIECEGNKFPMPDGAHGTPVPTVMADYPVWSYVHDGSLRGKMNAEYVLTKAIPFKEVPAAVNLLFDKLKAYGSVLDDSDRTSVHVHLNCQEFHLNRLTGLIALWFALEEVLTEFSGEHRVGNLFCLRAVDAPAIITYLKNFIRSDGQATMSEMLHYAGLNPFSLHKHGSLEIRTLQGCNDPESVITWVSVLERLHVLSGEFKDPRDIPSLFSSGGPLSFFDKLLGDKAEIVRQRISWNNEEISAAMFRGVRFAQELCYCRDWDEFNPLVLKDDPFGRDSKKLAAKISAVSPVGFEPEYDDAPEDMDEASFNQQLHTITMQSTIGHHTAGPFGSPIGPTAPASPMPQVSIPAGFWNAQFTNN